MKPRPLHALCVAALCSLGLAASSGAHSPTGRQRTGLVESVDHRSQQLAFRADGEPAPRVFRWNKRTRFVRDVRFVEATELRKRMRAKVIYHTPFFGKPFVSRVFILSQSAGGSAGK